MSDMLVKLYELPAQTLVEGVEIRRAKAPEKHIITRWIEDTFSQDWASQGEVAFANRPISCFIAIEAGTLIGFACYDATCKAFFGPTGVDEAMRGRGIGTALLLACLHSMWNEDYAYAIIGDVGPSEFYIQTVGAIEIEGSKPGFYRGMLR